ncbi:unnamed protein product [Allacma fusca]|uniref:C2H2-type domain-containing protein n=1 Tax=Allacma fusca TaxID=39272 RepID=A0A8J2NL25_9HEXA|nr:unnamed protein product [Allacma fusca]
MVVLDGHNMLGTGPNQYLQPDYLSPLPTTLDAKKSPLALLAQTCSQIGADTPSTKSLLPSLHSSSDSSKRKSSCSSETSSNSHASETQVGGAQRDGSQSSSSRPRSNGGLKSSSSTGGKSSPAFKPYETTCPPTSSSSSSSSKAKHDAEEKPKTPKSCASSPLGESKNSRTTSPSSSTGGGAGRNSVSNAEVSPSKSEPSRESKSSSESGKASPASNSVKDQGASPIIRSGLEVLHGHMGGGKDLRDYGKPALSSLSALAGYPPGFDPTNPALRPPFFASPSHHAAAAAAFMGYPPATGSGSPYVGYTRVKTPSGAETIVPVCKDPYCTGCQLGMPAGLMAAAAAAGQLNAYQQSVGVCPAGCVQCDHQKFAIGLPFMPPPGLSGIPTSTAAALASYSSSLISQHQQAQQQQQQAAAAAAQRPYVCNWIVGDSYCGKRFPSSEELLQHLRTHTNLSTTEAQQMSMSSPSSLYSSALLSSSAAAAAAAAAAMHRTYPTPPLSPLSAARYHPYGGAGGKPLSSLVPPHPPSLASYYPSPYSLYGQRIGPPVHP